MASSPGLSSSEACSRRRLPARRIARSPTRSPLRSGADWASEAIGHYQEALRLRPNDTKAHKNLGITLYQQGRFDEAAAHFGAALRIDPSDERARLLLRDARARSSQP